MLIKYTMGLLQLHWCLWIVTVYLTNQESWFPKKEKKNQESWHLSCAQIWFLLKCVWCCGMGLFVRELRAPFSMGLFVTCRTNHLIAYMKLLVMRRQISFSRSSWKNGLETSLKAHISGELGKLTKVVFLMIESNQLEGHVPLSIFNISSIKHLDLSFNQLSGSLSLDIGFQHPKLQFFGTIGNQIGGLIPESFSNVSALNIFFYVMINTMVWFQGISAFTVICSSFVLFCRIQSAQSLA